jgi:hypothetical protein
MTVTVTPQTFNFVAYDAATGRELWRSCWRRSEWATGT